MDEGVSFINKMTVLRKSILLMDTEPTLEEIPNHCSPSVVKKSWQELRQEVRNVRRQLSNLSSKIPTYFEFKEMIAENELRFYRIYFLSVPSHGRETTLLYCDVPVDCFKSKLETFLWQPLLESSFQAYHPQGRFSREEQLQWERKRLVIWGITSYDFQPSIGRFVFPACGAVFYCDDDQMQEPPLVPHELKNSTSPCCRLNPQMCPWNPDLIAFINNGDIWVHNVHLSTDIRLTYSKRGNGNLVEDPISAGIPSYITQEEFNRYIGFWWQPVPVPAGLKIYRLLYEEIDETHVDILHLSTFGDDKDVEKFRFPRAGTCNAKSTLKMLQFTINQENEIEIVGSSSPNVILRNICANIEYLVRAGWTPDGRHVWAEVLDRQQCHIQLILIPLSSFITFPFVDGLIIHVDAVPMPQVIYEEKSNTWINVHDILYFFTQEKSNEITFLWASEETGFRHLYLITIDLVLGKNTRSGAFYNEDVSRRLKSKIVLTSGEWEVSELDVWVNEKKKLVFFIGLKDTPLERHLYAVDIDNPKEPLRLTSPGFSHNIAMNDKCTLFVSIQSSISQTPFGQVYQIFYPNEHPYDVTVQALGYFLEPSLIPPTYRQPEIFNHRLQSGHLIYGMLFKPPNLRSGEKYPTVLTIYGGPEVQLVTNDFKGMRYLRQFLLATEGYVVIAIDCRGSRHRGVAFESHIKGRMGTVEIADHVEALLWLSETTGFIDTSRIAIHGWSYGGYLSLMGLAQRPDIFKVAIAGAPVTTWRLYDTGYTERYMGTPVNNPAGYVQGSVLSYIHQFPDEENRLLIIHGLRDENVHFAHTNQLINALIKAGKPYQLQIYPSERHSLRHLDASEHYETTLLSFLQQYL